MAGDELPAGNGSHGPADGNGRAGPGHRPAKPPGPPSPRNTATPRRHRAWAWAGASVVGLVLLLALAVAGFIGWGLYTAPGSAWLLSRVPGLQVDQPQGALMGSGFSARALRYAGAEGLRIELREPAWDALLVRPWPAPDQWAALRLSGLRAAEVRVLTGPGGEPLQAPPHLRLPVALELPQARIGRLQVDAQPVVDDLALDLHLGAEQGDRHRLQALTLRLGTVRVSGQGDIATGGDLPLRLDLQAQAPSAGPELPGWRATAALTGPLAAPALKLDVQPLGSSGTPAGAAALSLQAGLQPFAAWPLGTLDARLRELDLHALWPQAPRTLLSGQAQLQSSGRQAPAALSLALTNASPGRWDQQRLPLAAITLDASAALDDRSRLQLRRFSLEAADERRPLGRWEGDGEWTRDGLRLQTTLDGLRPAGLDARLPALALSGPLRLQLRGLPPPGDTAPPAAERQLLLQTTLEGGFTDLPRSPPARLELQAEATQGADRLELHLAQTLLRAGSAQARAQGRLSQDAQGRWQLQADGALTGFDPAVWWPAAAAPGGHRLDGRWQAALQGTPPGGTPSPAPAIAGPAPARLLETVRRLTQPVSGQATVTLADSRLAGVPLQGRLAWQRAAVAQPAQLDADLRAAASQRVQLQLRLAADTRSADAGQARLDLSDLAALAAWRRLVPGAAAWWPQAGRVNAELQAEGRWPALQSLGKLEADALQAPAWQLDRARGQWQLDGASLDGRLEADLSLDNLTSAVSPASTAPAAPGTPPARLDSARLQLTGTRTEHAFSAQARSAARPPAWAEPLLGPGGSQGGSALTLAGEGRWTPEADGARWQGRLARLRSGPVRTDAVPWLAADELQATLRLDTGLAARSAELAPGRLRLLGSALRWDRARWQAAPPGAPAEQAQLDLQAVLEPLPLAPLLASLQPDFGWSGDLVVAGRARVSSGARFSADVVVERQSGDLSVTDEVGTTPLGLTDLRLGLVADQGTWHATQAVAGAAVGVFAGAQTLRADPRAAWPAPQTPLEGVVELRVDNLGVWGPWTPPGWRLGGALNGRATLGGTFAGPEYTGRVDGKGLSARHLLQGVFLQDGDLALRLAGDRAQIERFVFRGGEGLLRIEGDGRFGDAPQARLRLIADRFQALGRLDRRVVVSGEAQMALDAKSLTLDGKLQVDDGLIDFSRGDAPGLDDDVTVVRRAPAGAPPPDEAAPPRVPRQTDVRLSVDLGQRLRLRGRGLNTLLAGDLRITTPAGRLTVNGTVRTEEGTYTAYGQNLRIERGLIGFAGNLENPRLDILALRNQVDVRVGVAVTGTALRPRVRLYSEPEIPDTEKLSWLVLGRAPEGVGRSDTALLQRAALALMSGESSGPSATERVSRLIGVDDITLRQSGDNDVRSTVVGLGKQISRRWYVGYERGVNSTTGTWQLIYRIAQRFTLRTQAGEDPAVDLLWIWRWNGRGIPPPSALLTPQRPRPP